MPKTRAEVYTRSLRRLGVLAVDEDATADMEAQAGAVLDALFAEVTASKAVTWTLNEVPDDAFLALVDLLATEIAPDYEVPFRTPRGVAWQRLMGVIRPDDRDDYRDTDEDGTISDAEVDAGERARFY